ncbi:MAG: SAM-dependent DNA methyltransferase [Okeania sp. SIO2H7]|nr:SAM-dependent DNA methyltransferase [Okeania sp. SIO2H7]
MRSLINQQSLNNTIKNICDIMRRSNCAGALQYIPEITWILFLRILDEIEELESKKAGELDEKYRFSLSYPYRWQDWGSPWGSKRIQLQMSSPGLFLHFTNNELIPYLKNLKHSANFTGRKKVISQIMSGINRVKIDTEKNLLAVLDLIEEISQGKVDTTHVFPISQVYESLLLKMGEKSGDGGQFFTPREIVRAMVKVVRPQGGETVCDPCCGTGGFLAQSYQFIIENGGSSLTPEQIKCLKYRTFYGREKENLIYPIALANLVLHGIDEPRLWHGNTLSGQKIYDGLFEGDSDRFDVILTNPPFGGKESKEVQNNFEFKTASTQVLFLQHIIDSLKPRGRCGIVLDEGFLFRTNEAAFVQTKQKLLTECNLWCIVSLPEGVFVNAGTNLKTNLLFFTKGTPTEKVWYYDLSGLKVNKTNPLTLDKFEEFFALLPSRGDGENSWSVSRQEIEEKGYDLKAVNPNSLIKTNSRTRAELLQLIAEKNREVEAMLAVLR